MVQEDFLTHDRPNNLDRLDLGICGLPMQNAVGPQVWKQPLFHHLQISVLINRAIKQIRTEKMVGCPPCPSLNLGEFFQFLNKSENCFSNRNKHFDYYSCTLIREHLCRKLAHWFYWGFSNRLLHSRQGSTQALGLTICDASRTLPLKKLFLAHSNNIFQFSDDFSKRTTKEFIFSSILFLIFEQSRILSSEHIYHWTRMATLDQASHDRPPTVV